MPLVFRPTNSDGGPWLPPQLFYVANVPRPVTAGAAPGLDRAAPGLASALHLPSRYVMQT